MRGRAAGSRSESRVRGRACRRGRPAPVTNQGWPSRSAASVMRPAASASRIAPDETGRPSSLQRRQHVDREAVRAPSACRKSGEPTRFLPKWKSKPTTAPACRALDQDAADEFLGADRPASAASKVSTIGAVEPGRSEQAQLAAPRRSAGTAARCGRKKPRGCGSKVSAAAGRRRPGARDARPRSPPGGRDARRRNCRSPPPPPADAPKPAPGRGRRRRIGRGRRVCGRTHGRRV